MKRSMKRSKLLLSALLTGIMVFSQLPVGVLAYAANGSSVSASAATGSLTISKTVEGTGAPSADTKFEFTVVKGDAPASGQYSVDGGDLQAIPADGKIALKAGQTAKLTGLEPGDYTVSEVAPAKTNYKSTSFSVNGGEVIEGLSASATVVAEPDAQAEGGWYTEDGVAAPDAAGYFTYTITSKQIDEDGNVTVDCNPVAEAMEAEMQEGLNWGSSSKFKVRFVNESGVAIQYVDYSFDTVNWIGVGDTYAPSGNPGMKNTGENADENSAGYGWGDVWQKLYPMFYGQTSAPGALNATGFDGNNIRLALAPLRCINPAVISYFKSNPGKGTLTGNDDTDSAQKITLLQMNAFPELIKKEFTFQNCKGESITLPADDSRTYADFICAFYGVDSLDDLTVAQKYNVLGTGCKGSPAMPYAGQSHITTYYKNTSGSFSNWCVPYSALNDGTLDYFKTWGFSSTRVAEGKKLQQGGQVFTADDAATYAYQNDYYLMENDPEVLKMAYDYLYSRCIRFSLDSTDRAVSTGIDNSATSNDSVGGIKEYMDKTDAANANVYRAMKGDEKIANGDTLALDNAKGYIEVPNAWNQFRYYDFGFSVTFKADDPQPAASVAFTNTYKKAADVPTPETPKPSKPGEPNLPKTGDGTMVAVFATAAVAVACIVTAGRKARKNQQ